MTPNFPTTRRGTRHETRRANSMIYKELFKTRRPDAPTAPVCAYALHRCAAPCACDFMCASGRARVGPSGARSGAGLRPSGRTSGRLSGVGFAPVRGRLLSPLHIFKKTKGESSEKSSHLAALGIADIGRLVLGSPDDPVRESGLSNRGESFSCCLQGRSINLEWSLVSKPLRDAMPTVAAWIDSLREAFGPDMINAAIRAGIDGQTTFWAKEGGQEVGTRLAVESDRTVSGLDIHLGPINPANAQQTTRKRL
jgi:hypothetical protein